ncbi:DUF4168 domain-containing protein [Acidiphilium acidophilum]|uniref:DUF4168 domain-containing protein n=1 Tax=Acidiphilium acidophilum TaxID=76588 RepID=UPI002E8E61C7|nr:DUF4168 domain-containing protein [Acidiphilium acidophilum]
MAHRNATISSIRLGAGLLAATLIAAPAFAQTMAPGTTPGTSSGTMMPAGPASSATIAKAGRAMHDVMAINQRYAAKLTASTDPATKQQIVARAKQKAESAITSHGLSVGQYNQVLASAQSNPALRRQLLNDAGLSGAAPTAHD